MSVFGSCWTCICVRKNCFGTRFFSVCIQNNLKQMCCKKLSFVIWPQHDLWVKQWTIINWHVGKKISIETSLKTRGKVFTRMDEMDLHSCSSWLIWIICLVQWYVNLYIIAFLCSNSCFWIQGDSGNNLHWMQHIKFNNSKIWINDTWT